MDVREELKLRSRLASMPDHDMLIELNIEVKNINEILKGNGGPGLCKRVNDISEVQSIHKAYFAILAAILLVGLPFITWLIEKV